MTQELITKVLTVAVEVIVVLVGGFLINYIKTKIDTEKLKEYQSLAKIVVGSIEQTMGDGNGMDKKHEAIQAFKTLSKGKLSDEQIEQLIEAAVYEMNILIKINGIKE